MKKIKQTVVSLGAVHTHTHTHTHSSVSGYLEYKKMRIIAQAFCVYFVISK